MRTRGAEMFGQLDGVRPDTSRAGVDENLLTRLHIRALDEGLPRRERDQGNRRGLHRRDGPGAVGEIILMDRQPLRERADADVPRPT